jgi:hypothetical protein
MIGVTPAAFAFAHVEYLTILFTSGTALGFAVGTGVGAEVGDIRVMGLIPAVVAYAGSENAVMDVMLHWVTSEVSALASAGSTVSE